MNSSRKKRLILIKPNGNHSNRLLQNLHFEVFCKEHQIEYQNPTFGDMAVYYVEPCNTKTNSFFKFLQFDLLGKLFRHSRFIKKTFSIVWIISNFGCLKLLRFDYETEMAAAEQLLLKAFEKNDVVYVAGWWFRLPNLADKYRQEMQDKYSLKTSFYDKSQLFERANILKLDGYTLIGVHIRRGDYKKWKGGIYCYDDEIYQKQMDSISKQLLQQGKNKYAFILFSNESVKFQPSTNLIISKENWFTDQHIMSLCDYLIGPPSTFTLWASYVGKAKLFHILDSHQEISI